MRAGPDEPAQYFVALRDLFFDSPVRIRKRGSNANQRFLETIESRTLSWEGHLLHHVALEVVAGRLDVATGEDTVKEFTDTSLVPGGHVHLSQVEWAAVYPGHRRACLANRTMVETPTEPEALKILSVKDSNG